VILSAPIFSFCAQKVCLVFYENGRSKESYKLSKMTDLYPTISHLLFADDSIFFGGSDKISIDALHRTRNTFCDGSCQGINLENSTIFSVMVVM
jgi:hypothetical protein